MRQTRGWGGVDGDQMDIVGDFLMILEMDLPEDRTERTPKLEFYVSTRSVLLLGLPVPSSRPGQLKPLCLGLGLSFPTAVRGP